MGSLSEESARGPLGAPDSPPGVVAAFRVLRERWWMPLLAALLCAAAAIALSVSSTKQYEATSNILFKPAGLAEQVGGASQPTDVDPEGTKATNLLLVTTTEVADRVRRALSLRVTPEDLLGQVEVSTESSANLVNITAKDPDPALAARIANTWAEQFVAFSKDSARAKVREGEDLLRERARALPADATADRAALQDALSRLILIESVQTGDVEVVDRASVPSDPSSPKPLRDGILAFLLGGALGIGLVFFLNVLDRRVKSVEEFESLYGARLLAGIPERTRDPRTERDRQLALEPFRILRNGLPLLGGGRPIRVILVTSAVPGEGKSTVAAGLARALALSGESCALVEVDLRRPTFHQQFDLRADPRGFTTAVVGGVPVGELLRPVLPGLKTLLVLPSGPLPPNPAELLRSPDTGRVLEELAREVDTVVLDAPPLLPIADSQVLLDHLQVDVCLIVARSNLETRDESRRTRAILDRHGRGATFGLVVNGTSSAEQAYDYYGADPAPTGGLLRSFTRS